MKTGGKVLLGAAVVIVPILGYKLLTKPKKGIAIQQVVTSSAYASGQKYISDSTEFVKLKGARIDLSKVQVYAIIYCLIWNGTDEVRSFSLESSLDGVSFWQAPPSVSISPNNWTWAVFFVRSSDLAEGRMTFALEASSDDLSDSVSIPFEVI